MKLLILAVVVFTATTVFAQNPYEYVDDALLEKVAKIVYDYDMKVAASRSSGNTGASSSQGMYQQQQVQRNVPSGQNYYRQGKVSNNFNNNNANVNYRRENNYGVQQQQGFRSQRQYNYGGQQSYAQQPRVQQQQTYVQQPRVQREQTYAQPRMHQQQTYVQPQSYAAVAPKMYQEPQVKQQQQVKSGFTYSYSQPEVAQRVAEFHFTENKNQGTFDSTDSVGVESNKYRLV